MKLTLAKLVKLVLRVTVIIAEGIYYYNDWKSGWYVIKARLTKHEQLRCPICGRKCKKHANAPKPRYWRTLDWNGSEVFIEASVPRVRFKEHGVHTARVSWARTGSWFTRDFEEQVAWLCIHTTKKAVCELMHVDWRTVGKIVERVTADLEERRGYSLYNNLVRIGIDETSYCKGHKYMWTVINHDTGKLIWVKKGNEREDLEEFFKMLTPEQRASIQLVSADGLRWIPDLLSEYCPNAKRCIDPFHAVQWANDALDEVRRGL
jgi:transposase